MIRTILKSVTITAGLLCPVAAFSQSDVAVEKGARAGYGPGTIVAGARLGMANVETLGDMLVTYGAFGDYALSNNLLVGGSADYWSKSSLEIEGQQIEINDFSIGAGARAIFTDISAAFRPYAAGGLALHRFSVIQAERTDDTGPKITRFKNVENDVTGKLGADLGGGVLYRVQRDLDVAFDARYRMLFDSNVDLDQLTFGGAIAYAL